MRAGSFRLTVPQPSSNVSIAASGGTMAFELNVPRGLFRFWVLFSAVWMTAMLVGGTSAIINEQLTEIAFVLPNPTAGIIPVKTWEDRIELEKILTRYDYPNRVIVFATQKITPQEVNQRSAEIVETLVKPRSVKLFWSRLESAGLWFTALVAIPLILLALGRALLWAFAGFASRVGP